NQFISDASDPLALAIPAAFFIKGVIAKNQNDKSRGIYLAESFAANVAFTYLLKKTINRKRPGETDPTFSVLTPASSRSFPSGHTSEAFSLATSLTIALPKWYVIAPAYTFAGLVGYSRMYLGAHYPSDVIAGALVGSGTAWLSYQINKKIVQRKKSTPR
ncbi:MAG: phosphatase PAP2 family protein, partial [Chitinophagaceae bacterium]|nr:phosphatase PAP2 family protein [Chitinophagaceae bacterium]